MYWINPQPSPTEAGDPGRPADAASAPATQRRLHLRADRCQMRAMALTPLHRLLEASFHPPAARGMDAVLRIRAGDEALTFRITHGAIEFDPANRLQPDTTFHFADVATAEALFAGAEDAFDAFMTGRFRADGYLMWAFTLMAMFRSTSLPTSPIE